MEAKWTISLQRQFRCSCIIYFQPFTKLIETIPLDVSVAKIQIS